MDIRHIAKRTAKLVALSIVFTGVVLYGIVLYLDWKDSQITYSETSPPLTAENPPSPDSFHPIRAVPSMPAITNIKAVAASEIQDEVADDDLVLGVELNGHSRAYSINMMTGPAREIFNDELAGQPIAATW